MENKYTLENLEITHHEQKWSLTVYRDDNNTDIALTGYLGASEIAFSDAEKTPDRLILRSPDFTLSVRHTKLLPSSSGNRKYDVTWEATGDDLSQFVDSYNLSGAHWYGLCQLKEQLWPVEQWRRGEEAFVAGDTLKDQYGGVQERYLLCSKGLAILIDPEIPLFLSVNPGGDNRIKMMTSYRAPYRNPEGLKLRLRYTLYQSNDVTSAHRLLFQTGVLDKPMDIPNEDLIRFPVWTTWARYKTDIDQETVIRFAEEIQKNGFPAAQIEVDDHWTETYGDLDFNRLKFPQASQMVARVAELGLPLTVWIHPFANYDSLASAHEELWVKSPHGGRIAWWRGEGRCLDVTNPAACDWFKTQLKALQTKYGVASFKFDAGEISWLPEGHATLRASCNPNSYPAAWAELAYQADPDGRRQEIRVGHRTQRLPVMVRMMDKDSKWDHDNGLRSLIPHALTFSILGYPFILADMIGGNAYHGSYPDRELFIRWLQVNIFLPCIQFSICPWQYDEEVVAISKRMMALREKYADKLIQLARGSCETGDPIIRPLWWIAPEDPCAQTLDSEFLVGNDLVVAPVLEQGARMRDVYLPAGRWRDEGFGAMIQGPIWIRNHPADLHVLPYFSLTAV